MQIKAAIFDLDGTLADTIEAIRDAINLTMKEYGYPPHTYEEIREYIGNGAKNLVLRSMPAEAAADAEQHARVFLTYQDNYDRGHLATDRCYDGMPDLIAALHQSGVRLAVLSNKQDRHVQGLIAQLFPRGEFSVIMGQMDHLPKKPDPTVPLMIAEQLGVAPYECAFVGDSEVDIRTAKNAGMPAIGVSWGYRDRELLIAEHPDALAATPDELSQILLK
jgi:phosphoglycolate phosphatase